jgi:hypothetical protein
MAFLSHKGTFVQAGGPFASQSVTGVGFQPTAVLFWAAPPAGMTPGTLVNGSHLAIGWCDEASVTLAAQPGLNAAGMDNETGERTVRSSEMNYAIDVAGIDGANAIIVLQARVTSLDADGFTLGYNTVDLRAGYFAGSTWHYLAFGGDFKACVFSSTTLGASTGAENVASLGMSSPFVPTALLNWTAVTTGATLAYQLGLGVAGSDATNALSQGALASQAEHTANPSNTYRYQRSTKFVVGLNGSGNTVRKEGTITAVGSNSLDLNWTTAATDRFALLALGGTGLYGQVVVVTQPAATGSQVITGLEVRPLAVLMLGAGGVASTSVESGYGVSIGASDGTRQGVAWSGDADGQAPSISASYQGTDAILLAATPAATASASTVTAKAGLTALGFSGFTLDWTTTDGSAREFLALVIGLEPVADPSERNLLTGSTHTVQGDDNLIAGVEGTVTGNRNVLFALTTGSPAPSITDDNTFKVVADVIDLTAGTVTVNGSPVAGGVAGPGSSTDNAITRFDGAGGGTLQNSAVTLDDTGALGFPDDVRQTFNPGSTNAGLNVGSLAGDPSSPSNGDLWYDSTANELTARINGVSVALGNGGGGGLILLEQHTASSSATLDFTGWYSSAYDEYLIEVVGLVPATDNVELALTVSTDGGSNYSATSYRYAYQYAGSSGSVGNVTNNAGTILALGAGVENTTSTTGHHGSVHLFGPGSSSRVKAFLVDMTYQGTDGYYYSLRGSGWWADVTAVDALRFAYSSGNIAEGTIRIYGLEA